MRRRPRNADPQRDGITIIELLVAVGIIGLLSSLLIPAALQSRATARRLQCTSNLHQIGVATHNFYDSQGRLPGTLRSLYELLPEIEDAALKVRIDAGGPLNEMPPGPSVFICPDDVLAQSRSRNFSYIINDGSSISPANGIRIKLGLKPTLFRNLPDGLSQTALFGERLISYEDAGLISAPSERRRESVRYTWHITNQYAPGEELAFAAECLSLTIKEDTKQCGSWGAARLGRQEARYNHLVPPNRAGCCNGPAGPVDVFQSAVPPTSGHVGGVNVLMADGSVHFFSNSVDLETWRALGSRNGNESVSEF